MKINAQTKVSEVLKGSSQAIDALISISAKFSKLKNPLLRKMMAPRVSLEQAAKIGGVRIDDLFIVLAPLGFELEIRKADEKNKKEEPIQEKVPAFVENLKDSETFIVDVRPIIAKNQDPLNHILKTLKNAKDGQITDIINTFEPIPLINLLEKKGYETHVKYLDTEEVHTYIYKNPSNLSKEKEPEETLMSEENFSELLSSYQGNMIVTDVRNLEMPLPMLTILDIIQTLPPNNILYVHHKKIPVYLLPELEDQGFEYFINELSESEVDLIIRHKS